MKLVFIFLLAILLVNCSVKEDHSDDTVETEEEVEFPYSYTENIPEVDFAFEFDYSEQYDFLFIGDSLIQLPELDSLIGDCPKILSIVDRDSSVYSLMEKLRNRLEGSFDLHLLVQSSDIGIIPINLDLYVDVPSCFIFKNQQLFYFLVNQKGGLMVQSEFLTSFDDTSVISQLYLEELTFQKRCETIDNSKVDSLLCTPFNNTFTVVNYGLYQEKYGDLRLKDLAKIFGVMLLIEKDRINECVGSFDYYIYDSLSPKFLLNNYTLPPPPEMVPPVPLKAKN